MRRALCVLLALLLSLAAPVTLWAQSGGNCSIFRSWITGDALTAPDLTSSFTTVGVTNVTQACIDGISDSVAGMQTQTSPYASGAESQATSGAGELERLRYVLSNVFGFTYWYRRDQNVDFATGTEIQGAGLGRHVTAVALHTWGGSVRWPALTSVAAHTSGIFFPAAHHLALGFDATADQGRYGAGQTNARSYYWFHAQALTLHHTAALRFAHSEATMHGGQRGHVTALRIDPATDQVVVGHRGTVLRLEGAGVSGGTSQVLAVAASGALSTTTAGGSAFWGSRGQFSGTGFTADGGHVFTLRAHLVQLMDASTHALTVRANPANINVDISDAITGDNGGATPNGRDRAAHLTANSWIHFYWIWHSTSSLLRGVASPDGPTAGPNLPTGFSAWSYAGTVRRTSTDASPLLGTHLIANMAYFHSAANILDAGSSATEAVVDASSFVPPQSGAALIVFRTGSVDANDDLWIRSTSGSHYFNGTNLAAGNSVTSLRLPMLSQRFFYQVGGLNVSIDVLGYDVPNGG